MISQSQAAASVQNMCFDDGVVLIRRSLEEDQTVMIQHESNLHIMRFIRTAVSRAEITEEVREMLQPWQGDENTWVSFSILLSAGNAPGDGPIGFVFLNVISYQKGLIEIGYRLHPDHHGKGYGYAAVDLFLGWLEKELQPNQCIAYCVCDNAPSWGLLEKLGFVREKQLLNSVEINGTSYDEYIYTKLQV